MLFRSRLDAVLVQLERGELTLNTKADPKLNRSLNRLSTSINRLVAAVVFAALLMVAALLFVNGELRLAGAALAAAVLAGIVVLLR